MNYKKGFIYLCIFSFSIITGYAKNITDQNMTNYVRTYDYDYDYNYTYGLKNVIYLKINTNNVNRNSDIHINDVYSDSNHSSYSNIAEVYIVLGIIIFAILCMVIYRCICRNRQRY
jgi:hypothetical protein